jgi:anti-anti-sigma regulatory factor
VQITNRLAASSEPVDSVLLDLELTNELDVLSAEMLEELHNDLDAGDVQLLLARVRPPVRDLLDRSGVTEVIGPEHMYKRVLEGVLVHLSGTGKHAEALLGLSDTTLKLLQQALNEMLAHDPHQAQLRALQSELDKAIGQTERTQS